MVGATICKKEFLRGRLFALVGCEIGICSLYSPSVHMFPSPTRSDWQRVFGMLGVEVDYSHIDQAEEEYCYKPYDEPKLFSDCSRGKMPDYLYRMQDGSLCSWVDRLLWIDAALPAWQYDWSFNKDNSVSFYNDDVQWSDEEDFAPFMWWTKVSWTLMCAEFQLGESAIECFVVRRYDSWYQRFISQQSSVHQ